MNKMNKIIKIISLTLLLFSQSSFAAEKSTVLLTTDKSNNMLIDFLNVDNNITAIQFDVSMEQAKMNKISLNDCLSSLEKSHQGTCQINKNGNLRVIIFSATNAILESGNIGTLNMNQKFSNKIRITNIEMFTPAMKSIKGQGLVDVQNIENERMRSL